LEDIAHHLSVLLLYAFRQLSSSWYLVLIFLRGEWHPTLLWKTAG